MRLRVGIWPCPTTWAWNLSMALPMCDPLAERSTPLSEEASPPATPTRIVPAAHPQRWAHDAEVTPPAAPLKPAIRRGGGEAPRRVLFASPVEAATQIFSPPVRAVRAVVTTTVANWAGVVQMTSVYGTTRSIMEWQREEWRREARPAIVRFSAHGVCGSGVACAARSCPPGSGTKVRCLRCSARSNARRARTCSGTR